MDREKFVRYAQLKQEISALEEELNTLKPDIMQAITEADGNKVNLEGFGMFSLYPTKKWEYSTAIKALEATVKENKKEEEANGTAQVSETMTLRFTGNKE